VTVGETLKARAAALARPAAPPGGAGQTLEVVEFRLGEERYALEQIFVREVLGPKELTPIPCTPPFVRGIVNVRGQIVAVIDIRKLLELSESGRAEVHPIIIVHFQGVELGIEADAVSGVRAIELDHVQASLPTLTGIRSQYLKGVADGQVVILDADKILTDPKLVVDEQVQMQ
jgi:purine-binding chemotaxis protein CheW